MMTGSMISHSTTGSSSSPSVAAATETETRTTAPSRTNRTFAVNRNIVCGRIGFMMILGTVAAALGYVAHAYISHTEHDLARGQFEATTDRMLTESAFVFGQHRRLLMTVATIVGQWHPHAEAYPFVPMNFFHGVASSLNDVMSSSGQSIGYHPIVKLDQQKDFEEYAQQYYYYDRDPPMIRKNTTSVRTQMWFVPPGTDTAKPDIGPRSQYCNTSYPDLKFPLFESYPTSSTQHYMRNPGAATSTATDQSASAAATVSEA